MAIAIARPNKARIWLLAVRPKTLWVAVVPVLVGSAIANQYQALQPVIAAVALIAALLIQIGANLANDLFDFQRGADTPDRIGPTRVTSAGLLTPREVAAGMALAFALAVLGGVVLVIQGGWPILVIGLLSILAGVAYTGGPFPLAYHGLGDVACFIFFGLVATVGTYYVQAAAVAPLAVAAAIPIGTLATAVLVVNNVRDTDTDRKVGKRTVPVRLGRNAGRAEYVLLLLLAYLAPIAVWLGFGLSPLALLPLLTLPIGIALTRIVLTRTDGPSLNGVLARTSQLLLAFGVLFAIGLAV